MRVSRIGLVLFVSLVSSALGAISACSSSSSGTGGGGGDTDAQADGQAEEGGASGEGGAMTGWTPKELPGVALWLAPSSITSASGSVMTWNDLSGKANDVATASGISPTVDKAAANGLDAVQFTFNPTDPVGKSTFTGVDAIGKGDFLVELVAKATFMLGSTNDIFATLGMASSNGLLDFTLSYPDAGNALAIVTRDPTGVTLHEAYAPTGAGDGKFHVIGAARASGMLSVRVDGMAQTPVADDNDLKGLGRSLLIGSHVNGDVAEVVFVAGTTSSADLAQLEAYLKAKYGTP